VTAAFRIVDAPQRSADWFAARAGIFTASKAGVLYASGKGKAEAVTRRDYRTQLALERLNGRAIEDGNGWENDDMKRGRVLEPAAVALYESITGDIVQRVGFLLSTDRPIGVSPDGVLHDFVGLLEVKCPRPANHLANLKANAVPSEYLPQIIHGQLVTGAQWTDFVSFCPDFPEDKQLLIVRVKRDEAAIASYDLMLSQFIREIELEVEEIRKLKVA
jgi:predicted phage-related endonuclease